MSADIEIIQNCLSRQLPFAVAIFTQLDLTIRPYTENAEVSAGSCQAGIPARSIYSLLAFTPIY